MEKRIAKTTEEMMLEDEALSTYSGDDRMISSSELLTHLAKSSESEFRFTTGIPSIDRICDGVEAGELILVTGPTGEGKTTLLMTITQNIAQAGIKSAWFTLEVTPRQFLTKLQKKNPVLPEFYLPLQNVDNQIEWIDKRIKEAKLKYGIQAVFIDHIHQIFSLQRVSNNVSLEIGDMVAKIKDIAIKNNLVIFLIAHCKDTPMEPTREPRKEDIRDSGLIVRLADTVIAIWRTSNEDDGSMTKRPKIIGESDNRSKVRILKNRRNGIYGGFVMEHQHHYLKELDGFIASAPKVENKHDLF